MALGFIRIHLVSIYLACSKHYSRNVLAFCTKEECLAHSTESFLDVIKHRPHCDLSCFETPLLSEVPIRYQESPVAPIESYIQRECHALSPRIHSASKHILVIQLETVLFFAALVLLFPTLSILDSAKERHHGSQQFLGVGVWQVHRRNLASLREWCLIMPDQ
jgi:hypothetical protein